MKGFNRPVSFKRPVSQLVINGLRWIVDTMKAVCIELRKDRLEEEE